MEPEKTETDVSWPSLDIATPDLVSQALNDVLERNRAAFEIGEEIIKKHQAQFEYIADLANKAAPMMRSMEDVVNSSWMLSAVREAQKMQDEFRRVAEGLTPVFNFQKEMLESPGMKAAMADIAEMNAQIKDALADIDRESSLMAVYRPTETELYLPASRMIVQPEPIDYDELADRVADRLFEKMREDKSDLNESAAITPSLFPADLKWEEITIKFLDGHEAEIYFRDVNVSANFAQMGFRDEKKKRPNKQWKLLMSLAVLKGKISWDDKPADPTIKKTKQFLSATLKNYFGISSDPFHEYRKAGCYEIKLELIPYAGLSELLQER